MNTQEAQRLLVSHLATYASRGYTATRTLIGTRERRTIAGDSGATYQLLIEVYWDEAPGGAIRVLGVIDDGTLRRAMFPMSEALLLTPGE